LIRPIGGLRWSKQLNGNTSVYCFYHVGRSIEFRSFSGLETLAVASTHYFSSALDVGWRRPSRSMCSDAEDLESNGLVLLGPQLDARLPGSVFALDGLPLFAHAHARPPSVRVSYSVKCRVLSTRVSSQLCSRDARARQPPLTQPASGDAALACRVEERENDKEVTKVGYLLHPRPLAPPRSHQSAPAARSEVSASQSPVCS
jgi:hypothetical protein